MFSIKKNWVFLAGLVLLCGAIEPSYAQNRPTLDLKGLNAKVDNFIATNEKNNQDVARAMNLLTQIQQEFQSIRGHMEASKVLQQESDKVYQDLDVRVSALEDKINQMHQLLKELKTAAPPAMVPGTAAPSGSSPQSLKEYEDFQGLVNLVNAQDFRAAASGFLGFLQKYPGSSLAGSAQYWVAECYYSLGDFTKAIAEFQTLVEKYPQHPKVKEGIFKQGSAFMRLKKYPQAKLFFQKVMATYPTSPEAVQAKARLLRVEELEQSGATVATNQPAPISSLPKTQPPVSPTVPVTNPPPPPPSTENAPPSTQEGSTPLF